MPLTRFALYLEGAYLRALSRPSWQGVFVLAFIAEQPLFTAGQEVGVPDMAMARGSIVHLHAHHNLLD